MKDINKLMEKYWEGETTLDEEKLIKEHFASGKSSDNTLQTLFNFFKEEKGITYKKEIKLPDKKVFNINFSREIALAASIVLLLGLAFIIRGYVYNPTHNQLAKYEVKDPDKAREITNNALAFLAKNFNKGEKTLSKNIKNINKIDIINSLIKNN